MVDFLRDFIHILRSSDIKISTAESIDAMRVVSLIGLDDKPLLQDSLSQTLAKNLREKEQVLKKLKKVNQTKLLRKK